MSFVNLNSKVSSSLLVIVTYFYGNRKNLTCAMRVNVWTPLNIFILLQCSQSFLGECEKITFKPFHRRIGYIVLQILLGFLARKNTVACVIKFIPMKFPINNFPDSLRNRVKEVINICKISSEDKVMLNVCDFLKMFLSVATVFFYTKNSEVISCNQFNLYC